MKLVIAEKPSVAMALASVLGARTRKDGYVEGNGYIVSWCVGHLVGLCDASEYDEKYKKWKLEDLPFLPKEYKYDVIPAVSRQYDVVHKMLHREDIDTVYWAGDAGKEGQTIEENIRMYGGVRESPTRRADRPMTYAHIFCPSPRRCSFQDLSCQLLEGHRGRG